MPLTNFPNGISSFGVPVVGAGPVFTTGNVFFVDSGHSLAADDPAHGKTADRPFATLDYAIGRCTANNADHIILMPGHAESVATAGGITVDVAGVSIIGVGTGGDRPTFTMSATAGAILISAANVTLANVLLTTSIDAVVRALNVTGDRAKVYDVEFIDGTGQAERGVTFTGDYCHMKGYIHHGATGGGGTYGIELNDADFIHVEDFFIDGNFSGGGIACVTSASANIRVHDGWIRNRNGADLGVTDTVTGSTGLIGPNIFVRVADDAANITEAIAGATFTYFDPIMVCNANGERSLQWNGTASADA